MKCPYCQTEVPNETAICPNCQKELTPSAVQVYPEYVFKMMNDLLNSASPSKKKKELEIGYIRTSKNDLEAAGVLFKEGNFPLSVYHLQQSVEKATKAFCLHTGILSIKEVMSIRHDPMRGYRMITIKLKKILEATAPSNANKKDIIGDFNRIRKDILKVARYDEVAIDRMISRFDIEDKKSDFLFIQMSNWMRSFIEKEIKDGHATIESREKGERRIKRIEATLSQIRNVPFLFVASALTFPHWEFTRYPDREIKPWDYDMRMGIVSRTPELIRRMRKVIEGLEVASA